MRAIAELLDLVRNGADPNWWQLKPSDLPTEWRDLMSLESDATSIANFEPLVVPGLLQTPEYATALISGTNAELSEAAVNALAATRMGRQTLLTKRNAPTLHAVVDEIVLRRAVGEPGVMPLRRDTRCLWSRRRTLHRHLGTAL